METNSLNETTIELTNRYNEIIVLAMWSVQMQPDDTFDPQWHSDDERAAFVEDWRRQEPNRWIARVNSAIVNHWRDTGEAVYRVRPISLDELTQRER